MEKKNNILDKIKIRIIAYPVATATFFIALALVFVFNLQFVTKSIDQAFYIPSQMEIESQIVRVNLEDYNLIIKKLNIATSTAAQNNTTTNSPATVASTTTPPEVTLATTTSKADLKIAIYNSTATNGLAATLNKSLVAAGFKTATTGSKSPLLPSTILKAKKNLSGSTILDEIRKIVSVKYAVTDAVLDDNNQFDIEIVIGTK
jgi:hypothetical protein